MNILLLTNLQADLPWSSTCLSNQPRGASRYGCGQTLSQATFVILMCTLEGHQTEDRPKLDWERGWYFSFADHCVEATTRCSVTTPSPLLDFWGAVAAEHLRVWNSSNWSAWLSGDTEEGCHNRARTTRVLSAWEPGSNSVEGQKRCEDAFHDVWPMYFSDCGEKAEGW